MFPGDGKTVHIVELSIATTSGVVASPHALRRTFVSVGESLELSPYVLNRLVGHSVGANDVTGTHYVEIELQRLRVAAQMIADAMLRHASESMGAVIAPFAPQMSGA